MDFLKKEIDECEKIRIGLPALRQKGDVENLIRYYQDLLRVAEMQAVIYARLRLMGDEESTQVADEMVHAAEQYMGKKGVQSFHDFIDFTREEVNTQIAILKNGGGNSLLGDWDW